MLKIGILVTSTPNHGGTFQYTLSYVEGVKRLNNVRITLYTSKENNYYNNLGLPIKRVISTSMKRINLIFQSLFNKNNYFEEEDIILAPIYSPILLNTKTPFVFTLHDLQEHYLPEYFSIFIRIWRNYINKQLCEKSSAIICESKYVKNDINRLFNVKEEKIFVIPCPPIEITINSEGKKRVIDVLKKYSLPDSYLFYPAQYWPHKNHIKLIEAFNKVQKDFPNINLVFTGAKKNNKTYQNVIQKIKKLGLEQKIIHLGYVEYSELEIIFEHSISLVLPTLFESISIPIYEAFQLGVPVCSSSVVGLPEQIGNAGILFDPNSIDSINSAITKVLSSVSLRKELIKRGHKRLTSISFKSFSNQLLNLLDSIASTKKSRSNN
jgi:glycosyltransferase involved in cell wall biosynthesis